MIPGSELRSTVVFLGKSDLGKDLSAPVEGRIVVCDANIKGLVNLPDDLIVPGAGEACKSFESLRLVLEAALTRNLDRQAEFVGVGGGAVCDLTAFAASSYLRGCRLVLVPTTLLAMVDASLGGKTGINLSGYKNLVGSFYPASSILVAVDFLNSLPAREFHSGLAEVIKSAMLDDAELFDLLMDRRVTVLSREPLLMEEVVRRSLRVKAQVVEADFRESGRRAILNLGHTFGHALEAVAGLGRYTHGEAVAWGIRCAMDLGRVLGVTDAEYARRVGRMLDDYEFPDRVHADPGELVEAMRRDKKRRGNSLVFVLQSNLGVTIVQEVENNQVLACLRGRVAA